MICKHYFQKFFQKRIFCHLSGSGQISLAFRNGLRRLPDHVREGLLHFNPYLALFLRDPAAAAHAAEVAVIRRIQSMASEGSPVAVFLVVLVVFVVLFVFAALFVFADFEEEEAFPAFPVEEGTAFPLSVADPP